MLRAIFFIFFLFTASAFGGQRIVSLSPALTELLFYLGLGGEVVGVTDFCTIPECSGKERVGGIVNPNVEKIIQLKATTVVATTMTPKRVCDSLESFGVKCLRFRLTTLKELQEAALKVAQELQAPAERAEGVTEEIEERARELSRCFKGKRLFIALSSRPLYAAGEGSYLGELFKIAGAEVVPKGSFSPVSLELLYAEKPQIILSFSGCSQFKEFNCLNLKRLKEKLLHLSPRLAQGLRELKEEACSR